MFAYCKQQLPERLGQSLSRTSKMIYFKFISAAIIALFSIPFYFHCNEFYFPRANLPTNVFHIIHKLLEKVSGPMHSIKDTDTVRLSRARTLYKIMTILEKRHTVSKDILEAPSSSGHIIPVARYTPNKCANDGCPAIIYYHGGGYTLGGISMYEHITTVLADTVGAVVFFIDYRLGMDTVHYNNHFLRPSFIFL